LATFAPACILYAAPAMSLQHTSALVTGGASGMGEATCRRLAAEGAHVVVVDRDAGKGKAVAAEVDGLFCEADVTDEGTMQAAVGIRVCTIAPGLIDTPLLGTLPEPQRQALAQSVLFPKRLGTADDFASLAMELVGNHYLNGEVIRMDAGIRMPPK